VKKNVKEGIITTLTTILGVALFFGIGFAVTNYPVRTFDITVTKARPVAVIGMNAHCSVIWDEHGNAYDMNEFPELYDTVKPGQRWRITTMGVNVRILKRSWITGAKRLDKEQEPDKLKPGEGFI
jgi:hypothetical protein